MCGLPGEGSFFLFAQAQTLVSVKGGALFFLALGAVMVQAMIHVSSTSMYAHPHR